MTVATPLRLGVTRRDRPLEAVAVAEARVLEHELTHRLGPVTLDLRVDGGRLGPWRPLHLPGDRVDAEIDPDAIWGGDLPPLTAVFARTVDPDAADVRRRMLTHLGALPIDVLDAAALERATELPLRPTDLWLLVNGARAVTVDDVAIAAMAGPDADAVRRLDAALDALAEQLRQLPDPSERTTSHVARLTATITALEGELAEARSAADRDRVEALHRIDELVAENRVLRERLQRAELGSRS